MCSNHGCLLRATPQPVNNKFALIHGIILPLMQDWPLLVKLREVSAGQIPDILKDSMNQSFTVSAINVCL